MSAETQLRYLLDRLEIQDVIARYAVGQDAHQRDDGLLEHWHDVFTPDAMVDYTEGGFRRGTYVELAEWMRGDGLSKGDRNGRMHEFTRWQHMMGLPTVDIDGDSAKVRSDLLATHKARTDDGSPQWYYNDACTFHDDFVRTTQGWRIAFRLLEVHWADPFPVLATTGGIGIDH